MIDADPAAAAANCCFFFEVTVEEVADEAPAEVGKCGVETTPAENYQILSNLNAKSRLYSIECVCDAILSQARMIKKNHTIDFAVGGSARNHHHTAVAGFLCGDSPVEAAVFRAQQRTQNCLVLGNVSGLQLVLKHTA